MTTLEMLKEAYEEGHDKEAAFSLRETLRNIGSGTKDTVDILGKNIAYGASQAKETMKEIPGRLKEFGGKAGETIKDIPGRAKNLSRDYIDRLAFKDYRGMSNKAKDYARQLKLMNLDPEYAYPSAIGEAEAFLRKRKGAFRNSALTVGGTALGLGALGYGAYRLAKGRGEEEPTKEANYKPRSTDIGNDLEYAKWLFGNKVKEIGGKYVDLLKFKDYKASDRVADMAKYIKKHPNPATPEVLENIKDVLSQRNKNFRNSALTVGGTALGLGALGYGGYRLAKGREEEPTKEANYKPRSTDIGNDLEYAKWMFGNKVKEFGGKAKGKLKNTADMVGDNITKGKENLKSTLKDVPGKAKNLGGRYIDLLTFKDYRELGDAPDFLRSRKGAFRNSALAVGGTALGLGALGYGAYRLANSQKKEEKTAGEILKEAMERTARW